MRNTRERRFNNSGVVSWNTRTASVLITLVLLTSAAHAEESNPQAAAEELQRKGDLSGAEKALKGSLREASASGPRSLKAGEALAVLGVFYQDIGRFSQAESCFTNSLGIFREIVGPNDLALTSLVVHLAWLYVETGRAEAARRLHPEAWVERLTLGDPDSRFLPMVLETTAGVNALEGRFAAAQRIYQQNFDLLASRGSSVSVEMASALNNFGFIQLRAGHHSDASTHFSKALNLWLGFSDRYAVQVAMSRLGLAEAHVAVGRYVEAGDLLSQVLPVFEQNYGPNSLRTEDVLTRYAEVLRRQKRRGEAEKMEERSRLIWRAAAADLAYKHVIDAREIGKTIRETDDAPQRVQRPGHSSNERRELRPALITRPVMRRK